MAFELEFSSTWQTVADVERSVAHYIEAFYNSKRCHSHNRFLSPVDFENFFREEGSVP